MSYVLAPQTPTALSIVGSSALFPVRRVYCVGRNYVEHAKEMGFTGREPPFFFLKPADAVVPARPNEETLIAYPPLTKELHHEVELVVAVGEGGKNISAADAFSCIFGYAVGLDMTRRDLQGEAKKLGRPWEIGKAFDQSAPIGALTPKEATGELLDGAIELSVNGKTTQRSDIAKLIWRVNEIIEHLSAAWELKPGDLIMTGTPEGVASVDRGDIMVARCVDLMPLRVRVV